MSNASKTFGLSTYPAPSEHLEAAKRLQGLLDATPLPSAELIDQFALYATPGSMRRFINFDRFYQKILDLPGVIFVFGVRWGRDLCMLQALQQIYEPMNYTRRVVGFDTFSGFPSVSSRDGTDAVIRPGAYTVTSGYEEHLAEVLSIKGQLGTYSHMERVEICKGDAAQELRGYLERHPETVVALSYFDLDLYEPTRDCAELILPYLADGAVVAFDEFIHPVHPGETQAAREVFGNNAAFRRIPTVGPGHSGYLIFHGDRADR
jgi:hypothetical protein